ncbi:MAG: nucleotidyltransferase family protein [Clostridia bacterium]|nr:nucleotidyltransferase family protein [Clostridia bacterium]
MIDNKQTARHLIALLGAELLGKEFAEMLSEEEIKEIYTLSKAHDLAHIAGDALSRAGLLQGEAVKAFQKWQYLALYRYQRVSYEISELRRVLNDEKIPFMPLKGTVLREHYPDPAMRTSVDIDILVHGEDLERVKNLLIETLSYRFDVEEGHDVSFFAPSELHVEIHFALCDEKDKRTLSLGDPWENAHLKEGSLYEYEMTNEFFYAYTLAHAAKHFYVGGCGIRPFMDMVVMRRSMPRDEGKVKALLDKAGLSAFAAYAEKLCDYWFFEADCDETIAFMEEYLLAGGAFGTVEGYIVSIQGDKGGAYYFWRKVFLPYKSMKKQFPVLNKCPILLPFCHVARWFAIVFTSRRKKAAAQMKASQSLDGEKTKKIVDLQKKLKLG